MIGDILGGFYIGMAVFAAMKLKRPVQDSLAHDLGAAIALSVWVVPTTLGAIKGLRRQK